MEFKNITSKPKEKYQLHKQTVFIFHIKIVLLSRNAVTYFPLATEQ